MVSSDSIKQDFSDNIEINKVFIFIYIPILNNYLWLLHQPTASKHLPGSTQPPSSSTINLLRKTAFVMNEGIIVLLYKGF